MGELRLGDLLIVGGPPAAKLLKALAVIADQLHPGFDRQADLKPFVSRKSCVLCSLAVRDFLVRIGFNARVRPVCAVLWAEKNGAPVHSAGIGVPNCKSKGDGWNGHMIATVDDWLIDPTLYQIKRPAWPDLAGMMALPLHSRPWQRGWSQLKVMASAGAGEDEFSIGWLDNPKNKTWQLGGDAQDATRRAPVIAAMVERFGAWRER
jgi:hypothetical protein